MALLVGSLLEAWRDNPRRLGLIGLNISHFDRQAVIGRTSSVLMIIITIALALGPDYVRIQIGGFREKVLPVLALMQETESVTLFKSKIPTYFQLLFNDLWGPAFSLVTVVGIWGFFRGQLIARPRQVDR
ncbi:MAG: hypothetical protein KJ042_03690, partial [Deltaproteobacteria bacterium]|nr:hypothetical protein [Deltaproteobacteria bacterium]